MPVANDNKLDIWESTEQSAGFVRQYERKVRTFPKVRARELKRSGYLFVKRFADIVLSLTGLIVLSPVFLIVAVAIKLDSKGSVIYSQTRIGKNRVPFTMYKFRSMCVDADDRLNDLQDLNERDGPVFKIRNDPRVTKVGFFIRKTCIDELPQLVNIIKGEMSIVGPRPPLPNEVEQYTPYHMQRLSVTPGLTCYWQISDRDMTFDEWVDSDTRYIRKRSTLVDINIVLKTVLIIIRGVI